MKNLTSAQRLRRLSMLGLATAATTILVGCSVGGGSLTLSEGAMGSMNSHAMSGSGGELTDGVAGAAWTTESDAASSPVGQAPHGDLVDGTPGERADAMVRGSGVAGGPPHADLTD